jgi:pSer/pThr/pTyr-binding forkhead associated (FHA) protein
MQAKLFCKSGNLAGKEFLIENEATIGKHPTNDCVLDVDIVSSQHARIFFDETEGCFFVEDLHSRNGTAVDGAPVKYKEKLGDLHVITFSHKFDFIFQDLKGAGKKPPPKSSPQIDSPAEKTMFDDAVPFAPPIADSASPSDAGKTMFDQEVILPPDFAKGDDKMRTKIDDDFGLIPDFSPKSPPPLATAEKTKPQRYALEVSSVGLTFELEEGENVVGRVEECTITLDDASISRKHAVVRIKKGKVSVKDAGSKNKTFVDDAKIETEVEVTSESKLRFGAVEARLIIK